MLLNAPNNPTGQVYTQTEWRALANVLNDYPDVLVVTDEIYEHIYWGEEPYCSFLMACPEFKNRTVVINGISKAYAMTGWRIGYSAGPKHVIATMKKVQSQMTSSCCAISQWASVAALNGDQSCIEPMREAFKLRHDMVLGRLNAMPGVTCLPADGAFYAFADFSQVIAKIDGVEDDTQLCEWLLEKADVALVPGAAFGMPGYARISYATDMDSLNEAMDRLDRVLPE